MRLVIPHKFSKFEATKRVKDALFKGRSQMPKEITNFEESWKGDTLTFAFDLQGKRISGTLDVTDKEFLIQATLPLMWRLFEGKIERAIGEQMGQYLK